jgi:tetratricopeptide (TPR) repeat protein
MQETTILKSSKDMRVYRVDYGTTFRAAVDALRLINESSAKLVKYDAGVIVFRKPNNRGTLEARVKSLDEQRTRVVMSATNSRKFWFDANDEEKRDAFFNELDKLLGSVPVQTDAPAKKEAKPLSSEPSTQNEKPETPPQPLGTEKQKPKSAIPAAPVPAKPDPDKAPLLAELRKKLNLDSNYTFLDNLTYDEMVLLNQKLDMLISASASEENNVRQCAACYIDLARLHHNAGHYVRAGEALKTAIAIYPDSAIAYCNLGDIYKHLGRVEDAIDTLNKAKALDPDLPDTYINLGIMYDDYINDDEKALEYYKTYLKLGGTDKQVFDWIRAIEQGS